MPPDHYQAHSHTTSNSSIAVVHTIIYYYVALSSQSVARIALELSASKYMYVVGKKSSSMASPKM